MITKFYFPTEHLEAIKEKIRSLSSARFVIDPVNCGHKYYFEVELTVEDYQQLASFMIFSTLPKEPQTFREKLHAIF